MRRMNIRDPKRLTFRQWMSAHPAAAWKVIAILGVFIAFIAAVFIHAVTHGHILQVIIAMIFGIVSGLRVYKRSRSGKEV